MSQHSIINLNYMSSGKNRTFINMDTSLNVRDFYDYVHLLAIEDFKGRPDARLSDILLEQQGYDFFKTKFIEICKTNDPSLSTNHQNYDDVDGDETVHEEYWNSILSTECSALALEGPDKQRDSILLNEQQQYYNDLSEPRRYKWVRLYLSCCTDDYKQKMLDFFNNSLKYSNTYVIEHNQIDENKNTLDNSSTTYPLYEFKDIAVKSSNSLNRSNIIDFDSVVPRKTEDYYLPNTVDAISFNQHGDQTYLITTPTNVSPLYISIISSSNTFKTKLESEDLKTYLYNSYESAHVSSFSEHLISTDVSSFYNVRTNIPGIDYNYIAKIPMTTIASNNSKTDYDNGNIYAQLFNTKTMYNSIYKMQMSSDMSLQNCRDYIEVNSCAGDTYLKYNDNVNYTIDSTGNIVKNKSKKVSYPKIESINQVVSKTNALHKSYFFSINLQDIGDEIEYNEENAKSIQKNTDKLKKEIKHDIEQAIRQIVDNVCPVQTQLFEVQYSGKA